MPKQIGTPLTGVQRRRQIRERNARNPAHNVIVQGQPSLREQILHAARRLSIVRAQRAELRQRIHRPLESRLIASIDAKLDAENSAKAIADATGLKQRQLAQIRAKLEAQLTNAVNKRKELQQLPKGSDRKPALLQIKALGKAVITEAKQLANNAIVMNVMSTLVATDHHNHAEFKLGYSYVRRLFQALQQSQAISDEEKLGQLDAFDSLIYDRLINERLGSADPHLHARLDKCIRHMIASNKQCYSKRHVEYMNISTKGSSKSYITTAFRYTRDFKPYFNDALELLDLEQVSMTLVGPGVCKENGKSFELMHVYTNLRQVLLSRPQVKVRMEVVDKYEEAIAGIQATIRVFSSENSEEAQLWVQEKKVDDGYEYLRTRDDGPDILFAANSLFYSLKDESGKVVNPFEHESASTAKFIQSIMKKKQQCVIFTDSKLLNIIQPGSAMTAALSMMMGKGPGMNMNSTCSDHEAGLSFTVNTRAFPGKSHDKLYMVHIQKESTT